MKPTRVRLKPPQISRKAGMRLSIVASAPHVYAASVLRSSCARDFASAFSPSLPPTSMLPASSASASCGDCGHYGVLKMGVFSWSISIVRVNASCL